MSHARHAACKLPRIGGSVDRWIGGSADRRNRRAFELLLDGLVWREARHELGAPTAWERMMNSIDRKQKRAARRAALACIAACIAGAAGSAWAKRATTDVGASMVQPPQPPASGANANNPDNMPIKRPDKPTHDPIARRPPASSTQPK